MSQIKVDSIIPRGGLPGGATAGGIIQMVQTVKSDTYSGTSDGSEISLTGLTVTITPQSSSNKILLVANIMYSCTGTTYKMYPKRGSTVIGVGDADGSRPQIQSAMGFSGDANQAEQCTSFYIDSPGAGTHTYSFYAINDNAQSLFINRSVNDQNNNVGQRGISTITAIEVSG